MPTIDNYISRLEVFEPEVISVMANAYELAIASCQPPVTKNVRERIAACIISLAKAGERNPHQLCEKALAARSVLIERESSGLVSSKGTSVANQFGAHDKVECPQCHAVMSVVRRTPHPTLGALCELQIVECAICKFSEERTVDGEGNDRTSIVSLRASA